MAKPLRARRPQEQIIAECLRGLADEMSHLGYPEHGLIVRLAAADFERLTDLHREMREGAAAIAEMAPEGRA